MIPTAETLLKDNFLLIEDNKTCECHTHLIVKVMIEFAKLHCIEQAKVILKNAELIEVRQFSSDGTCQILSEAGDPFELDKDSILNAYSLDLIK